jgi:hypothetical protein
MSEQPVCRDCWYLQRGWHLGEAPREPDDSRDVARDADPHARCAKHKPSPVEPPATTDPWKAVRQRVAMETYEQGGTARVMRAIEAALATERQQHAEQIAAKDREITRLTRYLSGPAEAIEEVARLTVDLRASEASLAAQQTEIERLRVRAIVAEQHKVLDCLGKSSYQEVVEDQLRTQLAETQIALESAHAEITRLTAERDTLKARRGCPRCAGMGFVNQMGTDCAGETRHICAVPCPSCASRPHTQEQP